MPTCPECGTEQVDGRFCGNCGSALPAGRVHDEPPEPAWEDPGRPGRRWTIAVGTVLAAALVAVAALVDGPADPSAPLGVATATPTPAPDGTPLAPLPRPLTDPGSCMDTWPGCTTWRTQFPDVDAIAEPVAGLDPRHLYVGAHRSDGTGALYAVDPTNGIQLWRRPLPRPPQRPVLAPWGAVLVAHGHTAGATSLRSYDPETGALRWEVPGMLPGPASVPPAAGGRTVLVGGPGRLLFRDLEGPMWVVEIAATPLQVLVAEHDAGATFLVQTDREEIRAYAEDGTQVWSRTSSRLATAVEDGRTVVVDAPDHLVGIDVRGGEVWRTALEVGQGPVVVRDGQVTVVTDAGDLVRLSLADGRELGRTPLATRERAAFTIEREVLLTASCGGVVAEDVGSGAHLWDLPLGSPEDCAAVPVAAGGDGHLVVAVGRALYGLQT